MRSLKALTLLLSIGFLIGLGACSEEEVTSKVEIPTKFSVDIPSSISSAKGTLNGRTSGDGDGVIEGDEIYESLRHFIKIGEGSAEILELTLLVGAVLETQDIRSLTFESDDDGREKRLDIEEDVTRGGVSYAYEMTMIDVEDGELALQLLWNNDPVEGVGILRPYYIDRIENDDLDAYIRIDYSEDDPDYEATMIVSISGLETPKESDVDNIKMWVGKNGDIVEVRGNSNHPEIVIVDEDFTGGRNYAFVGRGDESTNLGVVKLALPPSSVETADVLEQYSVYAVLEAEINAAGITDQGIIDAVLAEAHSPAYFNSNGFITSGEDNKPDSFSDDFVNLDGLNPFVPVEVRDLEIEFFQ